VINGDSKFYNFERKKFVNRIERNHEKTESKKVDSFIIFFAHSNGGRRNITRLCHRKGTMIGRD
jgi:undecaprenyl pyrophosphate synthase